MSFTNTQARYGTLSKIFHWATVLLIFTLIPLGIMADDAPFATDNELTRKAYLFSLHKTLGITLFFLAVLRILWALVQPKPGSLNPDNKPEHFMAEMVHWLLYGSLIIVPLTGWITHAASQGFAPIWWPFGQSLPFIPKSVGLSETASTLHMIFERVLVVSILLHFAGALKHHVIDRDATLRRMWFGRPDLPQVAPHHPSFAPLAGALVIWIAALGLGAGLGFFAPDHNHDHDHAQAPVLEAVSSEWQVETGSIALSITQFGSQVDGSFAEWTSVISFDPNATGILGHVETEIAIASLTLGSVTGQSMGTDYFDAAQFPTATFTAEITATETDYVATGTLTLKGTTIPITLPFTLEISNDGADDIAMMTGATQVNRTDFGIGASGEDNLAHVVDIAISLTARR